MDRRTVLKAGGMALAGFGLSGCAPATKTARAASPTMPRRPMLNLAPVRASWERVIRTTIGLRPHRDSGFVLRAEKFDAKTVVHNFGHGGAGMSLAWGTGAMAADMALQHDERRAAVLGCGSPGLTAARQLQRRGFQVTIYAMTVPPNTTSNMSSAGFTPTAGLVDQAKRTPAWDAQFRQAAEISYRQLQLLVNPVYGIYWIDTYNATDNEPSLRPNPGPDDDLLPEPLRTGKDREIFGPGEHPFPAKYAVRSSALAIEPSIYLEALMRDFAVFGGKIVIRKFETPRDLMSLTEPVIVNCTGLGSKALFNDDELVPIRGQLTVMVPQPEVHYRASGLAPNGVQASMNPRSDGLVIGNMMDRGNWSLDPDEAVRQRNVDAAVQFFSRMRPAIASAAFTRSQPPRTVPDLESFYGQES